MKVLQLFLLFISCIFSHALAFLSPTPTTTLFVGQNYNTPSISVMPKTHDTVFKSFPSSSLDCAKACAIPVERLCTQIKEINPDWSKQDFANYFIQTSGKNELVLTALGTHFELSRVQPPKSADYYEVTPARQVAICQNLQLYAYQGFRDYVATFKEYPQFIRNLCAQLDNKDFCRPLNQQLTQSHEFQTSNQWHARIPVNVFYDLRQALPPEGYAQQRINNCQQEAQQIAGKKQNFIDNAQQVLQDRLSSTDQQQFAQNIATAAQTANGIATTQQHDASPQVLAAAQQQGISAQEVQVTYGSQVKHITQDGLIACGDQATTKLADNVLAKDITQCALVGIEYNQAGLTEKAYQIANICYAALDCAKKGGSFAYHCAEGFALGIYDGVAHVGQMIVDPKKTASDFMEGVGHLLKAVYCFGDMQTALGDDFCGPRNVDIEQYSRAMASVTCAISHKCTATPTRELIRQTTALGVEGFLSNKLIATLGSLCTKTARLCATAVVQLKNTVRAIEIVEPIAAGIGEVGGSVQNKTGMLLNEAEGQIRNVTKIEAPIAEQIAEVKNIAQECPASCPNQYVTSLKPLGRGSTGRTIPSNLHEQLTMKEIVSNPIMGTIVRLKKGMTDPRWPSEQGWIKMAWNNNGTEIHYVAQWKNGIICAVDDFKFK